MPEKTSLRQDYKAAFRLLNLVRRIDASILPQKILLAMLQAWTPYISLFFTAQLINDLVAGAFGPAAWAVVWLLGSNFVLGTLRDYLDSRKTLLANLTNNGLTQLLREKAMDLDYADLCDPKVVNPVTSAEQQCNYTGTLSSLVAHFMKMLQDLLSSGTALLMVIYLCFAPGKAQGLLAVLCSPAVSLSSLLLMVGGSCFLISRLNQNGGQAADVQHAQAENGIEYMVSKVFCNIEAGKVIRLYHMQQMLRENYSHFMHVAKPVYVAMCRDDLHFSLLSTALSGLFSIYAYLLVLWKVLAGAISIGSLAQYTGALATLQDSIISILQQNRLIRRQVSYLQNFLTFLNQTSGHSGTIPIEKRQDHVYEIAFHDVSFTYPGSSKPALSHVSCRLTLKDKMAVVGLNGAGKTTFIKLLCRLYDPSEGYITLNGVDIRKYDYREYQSLFGVVFQDFHIFPLPVGQNVGACLKPDEQRVWQCLDLSGVAGRIRDMGQGLDTPVTPLEESGEALSGGEMQKVAIARALYKDAAFVILDEPTAALDPLSEYEIYSHFDDLVRDKTSIYISHRMSSCRFCGDILVFQDGQIRERGSHEALLQRNGLYAAMWNAQAQYYK